MTPIHLKLRELIAASDVASADKELLLVCFEMLTDKQAEQAVELLENGALSAAFMASNIRSKIEAFTKADPALWKKVISEELATLDNVS